MPQIRSYDQSTVPHCVIVRVAPKGTRRAQLPLRWIDLSFPRVRDGTVVSLSS